jgi:hypothetical protein
LTTLLRLEQSYAVKAATGVLIRHATTVSIHRGFSMSPGFLLRLFRMASLVSWISASISSIVMSITSLLRFLPLLPYLLTGPKSRKLPLEVLYLLLCHGSVGR